MNAKRRLLMAAGGALALPQLGVAQSVRIQRLCWLSGAAPRSEAYNMDFVDQLGKLGFVEGKNLAIEFRSAGGSVDRFPEPATEMARLKCDVFFSTGAEANFVAVKQVARDTPIVIMAADYDPVATGHVASLARPGGRITGVVVLQTALVEKRVELLRELLPQAKRIGVLADVASAGQLKVALAAGKRLGVELYAHEFRSAPYDFEAAFADLARAKVDAVMPLGSTFFVLARRKISELALKHRLPGIFNNYLWAEAGGLLSYGTSFLGIYRRAAVQMAKVLNGEKPANIPIEQPTVVELVINMKTAKALGITIPQGVWFRAERVIE
jgi:putative ABC transport system substrate-binding protein